MVGFEGEKDYIDYEEKPLEFYAHESWYGCPECDKERAEANEPEFDGSLDEKND